MPWRDYIPKRVRHFLGDNRDIDSLVNGPQTLISSPNDTVALPEEKPKSVQPKEQKPDTAVYGPAGTPIVSGFVEDLQEYNPALRGRNALPIYEQMRRSDADVAATLAACKLPIRGAELDVVPPIADNEPGYEAAKQIADACKENLFGGLEMENSLGMKSTQRFESVIYNALLSLDYGCSGYEDIYTIDGNMVRLKRLAPRLPLTFYRFHIDPDGETLKAVEQWGYRGQDWVNVVVPADKFVLFSHDLEGANFYGKSILRPGYKHWYRKQALEKIDAIACERNGVGVAEIIMGPNATEADRLLAINWVENLAAMESSGIVLPNGWSLNLKGVQGREHDVLQSIRYESEMICRSVLAMFMTLGTTQSGSRAVGDVHVDFFQLSLQAEARFICDTISETTIRRWTDYNFPSKGKSLPYPKLQAPHIAVLNPLDLFNAFKDLGAANVDILHPDDETENWVRDKVGLPRKGTPRPRFAPTAVRVQEESEEPVNELEADKQTEGPIGKEAPTKGTFSQKVHLNRALEGRMKWHGLDISIENAAGSTRKWKDRNGKTGETKMKVPYGYIRVVR